MFQWKTIWLWIFICSIYSYGDDIRKLIPKENKSFHAPSVLYDVYYCSSVSVGSMNDKQTYQSGFYGAQKGNLKHFNKILDLSGYAIDDCDVDSRGNMYWTDRLQKSIFKADATGKRIEKIVSGFDIPIGLAVDEKHQRVYWVNWLQKSSRKSGVIGYTDISSKKSTIVFQNRVRSGGHLTISDGKLYISDLFGGKILKMDLKDPVLHTVATAKQPSQVTIAKKYEDLIWGDISMDSILAVGLNGYDRRVIMSFKNKFSNPNALIFDSRLDKLLFVSPVANKGLGPSMIGGLHTIDIDGMHMKLLYSHSTLNFIQKLMIRGQ
jgi:hypothetical protein